MRARTGWSRGVGAAAVLLVLLSVSAPAQDSAAEARFTENSLRLRTALHYDPLLDEAIDALVKLYTGAERSEEIIALYRSHITQYPNDAGAKTVLLRLLRRLDRKGADEAVAVVVSQHPDYAPLQYVLFRHLEERGDPRAVEALARAIDLESDPSRRNAWLEELMRLSEGETARAATKVRLGKLVGAEGLDANALLTLAKLAQRHRFWEEAVLALKRARSLKTDAETRVEIEYQLASALGQSGSSGEAGALLDGLLARLAPDHWRRREILALRFGVLPGAKEREALLATLKAKADRAPTNESAALDYAEALLGADRRAEATAVLVAASTALPKSSLLETRALELLETSPDQAGYADYLTARLESSPERLDLRFRLVKAEYALRRDAAAEQDFQVVVAGLDSGEVSDRILELQRYLRSIDRPEASAPYLEKYVKDHPSRLDVARELAEILIEAGREEAVGELVADLAPAEAGVENVLDFADFLLDRGFVAAARKAVEIRLGGDPRQFELGLKLVEVLGRSGEAAAVRERLSLTRELADTPPRYSQWLKAAVAAHRDLESLASFFDSEWSRYAVDDGAWPEEKVEKFLLLCEAGRRQIFAPRVAEGLRKQLAQPGIEAALKLRLRRVLVAVLESDPASAGEAEEQMRLLETEDSAHRVEHRLRRALLHARTGRIDLARELLGQLDFDEVTSAALLREGADVLIEFRMLAEAEDALGVLVRLEPEDLLSMERHLSVLAARGDETSLRITLRRLLEEDGEVALREESRRSLRSHLEASYWRSVAALMETADLAEALPLLASVEQEIAAEGSLLWADWVRARILARLDRSTESREAFVRFLARAELAGVKEIGFPDGLTLAVESAESVLEDGSTGPDGPTVAESPAPGFLVGKSRLAWVFELTEGLRVVRTVLAEGRLLVQDDLDRIHCLDHSNGKLMWSRTFGSGGGQERRRRPEAFDDVARPPGLEQGGSEPASATEAPPLLASADRFFLVQDDKCLALAVSDGSPIWSTPLGKAAAPETGPRSGRDVRLGLADGRLVIFDAISGDLRAVETSGGKLLWETNLPSAGETPAPLPLQSGLVLSGDLGFAFGRQCVVFDSATGSIVWQIRNTNRDRFPLVLRPPREGAEEVSSPSFSSGPLRSFDFTAKSGEGAVAPERFLTGVATLVGPAVHWSEARLQGGEPASAEFGDGFLWLMLEGKVRRLSVDLPIQSRELPAAGSFVGRFGQHLWFVDGPDLVHADFRRLRSTRLALGETGGSGPVRATLMGRHLLVRGGSSLLVVNALTSEVIGKGSPPESLARHLSELSLGTERGPAPSHFWQGQVTRQNPGQTPLCLDLTDEFSGNRAYCLAGDRVVFCLENPSDSRLNPPGNTPPPATPK